MMSDYNLICPCFYLIYYFKSPFFFVYFHLLTYDLFSLLVQLKCQTKQMLVPNIKNEEIMKVCDMVRYYRNTYIIYRNIFILCIIILHNYNGRLNEAQMKV